MRRRERDKESGATAVEFVVFTPLLLLLMFGSVQIGLALFARHVAVSAAQEGAREARETAVSTTTAGWQNAATTAATTWVTQLLGTMAEAPTAQAVVQVPLDEPFPEIGVKVKFSVASAVPGWTFSVSAQSVGPVECFYDTDGHCDGY